ncbi:MAG TPA: KH domain-containing protein [Thermoanaerobaculia bacterium]|nr:KH domain-containing protein [Thermoanaerobaculia bacterium]
MTGVAQQLRRLIQGLVDDRDAVEVDAQEHDDAIILRVTVDPDEVGRVIGRQGSTIKALRTLLDVRGGDSDTFYELEVDES